MSVEVHSLFVNELVKCSKIAGHPQNTPDTSSQDYQLTRDYFSLSLAILSYVGQG